MDKKEAIDIVRQMVADGQVSQEVAVKYFPELAESEDEKIRKKLIAYFVRYKEQAICGVKTFYGIPSDKILAWLEKQGEQKVGVELPIWEKVCLDTGQTILYKDGDRTYLERFGYRIDLKDLDMLPKKKKLKAQKGE